jgi:bifunctional non-homologous end joining protein LigD
MTTRCRASTASAIGGTTTASSSTPYLVELNGDDLRREPLDVRKATLASLLRRSAPGLRLNEYIEADGPTVFGHACKMGLEGIVSKRKAPTYPLGPLA